MKLTFEQLLRKYPEQQYELHERAAIHEFDGGLNRTEAEIRTAQEFVPPNPWDKLREEAGLI